MIYRIRSTYGHLVQGEIPVVLHVINVQPDGLLELVSQCGSQLLELPERTHRYIKGAQCFDDLFLISTTSATFSDSHWHVLLLFRSSCGTPNGTDGTQTPSTAASRDNR